MKPHTPLERREFLRCSAAAVLSAVMADGVYEHAQLMYSYGEDLYSALDLRADACVGGRACMAHCPQGLEIPATLAEDHGLLRRA